MRALCRHWFYEDFLRPLNPSLPSLGLRRFSSYLLHTSSLTVPLIRRYITGSGAGQQDLEAAFDEFLKYKTRVPVCGAVLLAQGWDKVRDGHSPRVLEGEGGRMDLAGWH